MKQMKFMVLIEHDFAAQNYAGYIPALRLSAVGGTKEEMLQNLKDVVSMELEKVSEITYHEHSYEVLQVEGSVSVKGEN
ncbi:hypothetical protein ACE41H_24590 [Paenibacillus enshidis]|uniref:Type II toxin-antitoxin system HicB family antitoxin n=1 Tax=Paenibacillus enshidis TaxID=1458439 RepID=A0ABV5B0F0_9BACL